MLGAVSWCMLRLFLPLIALVFLVGASVVSDKPAPPADFVWVNSGDVTILDPQRMSWMQDLRVARLVFEGLCRNDVFAHEFTVTPGVAESWEISEDQLEYTFTIREDARWSNGDTITAQHFAYSWRRAMLPDLASDYFKLFMLIDGAKEFYNWRTEQLSLMATGESPYADGLELWAATEQRFIDTVGIEAVDSRTFKVRLIQPTPYWLDLVAFAVFSPVYPPLVSQYEQPNASTGKLDVRLGWTKPDRLVNNGPFTLERWRFKRDMRLEANPYWWEADSLHIESMELPSVADSNAQILAYETGAAQYIADVTPQYRGDMIAQKNEFYAEHAEEVARMRAEGMDQFQIDRALPDDPRAHVHSVAAFGTYFWNFNCSPTLPDGRENPFADKRVRRAFAMMIDKTTIAKDVRRLDEPEAGSLVPPGSIGTYQAPGGLPHLGQFETEEERQALAERSRALLAEAGWEDPSKFPTVELLFNKDGGHDLIAQTVAKGWSKYLGVPVLLAQKELKVFRADLKNNNFITSRAGWYGDYGDPTTFLEINRTGDGNNDRRYSNPRCDELLNQAAVELDPEKRMALLEEVERIMMEEDVPMVPIFHYASIYMFNAHKLSGITAHPRTQQNLWLANPLGDGVGDDDILALPTREGAGGRSMTPRAEDPS